MTFDEKVRSDYYRRLITVPCTTETRAEYRVQSSKVHEQLVSDAVAYVIEQGVPAVYAKKVFRHAWNSGHAYGYNEVLMHLDELIEIFV